MILLKFASKFMINVYKRKFKILKASCDAIDMRSKMLQSKAANNRKILENTRDVNNGEQHYSDLVKTPTSKKKKKRI